MLKPTHNIATITRNGLYKTPTTATCWTTGQIDNLALAYTTGTNKLLTVTDNTALADAKTQGFNPGAGTGNYGYDVNGNLTADPYKSISSIYYNHLNLPTKVDFGGGKSIELLYNRAGSKLRKTVKNTGAAITYTQDYVAGLEYRTTGATGTLTLEAIYHPEGRVTPNGAAWRYEYHLKDHLGNTRLTFAELGTNGIIDVTNSATTTEILNENHYYPFGMNMNYDWINNTATGMSIDNKQQYNGKEMNDDWGLNWSDYGARWYDRAVPRWFSIDRFLEKYVSLNPYQYGANNPIKYVDVNGDSLFLTVVDTKTSTFQTLHWGYTKSDEYGFYTADGVKYEGDNEFAKKVYDGIAKLFLGKEGGSMISEIANSTTEHIAITSRLDKNVTAGSEIGINPDKVDKAPTEKGNQPIPFFITLGHEIAHAYANSKGQTFANWVTIETPRGNRTLSSNEKYASHIENIFRAENGLPLRTYYSPTEDGGAEQSTKMVDQQGRSLYYNTKDRTIMVPSTKPLDQDNRYKY